MTDEDAALFAVLDQVAEEAARGADSAHDILHVRRVAATAKLIAQAEGAVLGVVVPAALLHELINFPKDHPRSKESGEVCAERAEQTLIAQGVTAPRAAAIAECIRVHSFSRGLLAQSLEAKVLQDADRLDAIGAVGVARCFATGQAMGTPFYAPEDMLCEDREPDDKRWTVDHFFRKLLRIEEGLHTPTARALAKDRAAFMRSFLNQLAQEVAAETLVSGEKR